MIAEEFQGGSNNQTAIFDHYLEICWPHQECGDCLSTSQAPCSWCAASAACIPNTASIPILAPLFNRDICPRRGERFELRARPLGCDVSTITLLTSAVSVIAVFGVILMALAGVKVGILIGRWWRKHSWGQPFWVRIRRGKSRADDGEDNERRPLLGTETGQREDG